MGNVAGLEAKIEYCRHQIYCLQEQFPEAKRR
jgi:hypothetical protein